MYDNTQRYGLISRFFHWSMALGFSFLLLTVILWTIDEAYFSLMAYHKSVGFLMMVLVIMRAIWAALNWTKRPHGNLLVKLGHLGLYVLMIAVPLVALLRQYGTGRSPLSVFGMNVMDKATDKIEWMGQLGNAAHGKLGFALFALAVGHIGFAVYHQIKGEKIMNRMVGK
ncbi:cytochrome b [Wielerella bovis]|uniref:cytochrome b n=1 Tax=Wielerella bovis TaxID=2917790 RepID=UPI0020184F6F|nr:cytochrome b [Wielerella bovis]ULJ59395.1 cytochrome b [Wielerella bovis]ULJ61726.1 cytochrome b [Wielerella bovis]ULJ63852.1 cytochrome b [Wielerella bovis]ULJ65981.1 cytochrome b [Wielerella bovis]